MPLAAAADAIHFVTAVCVLMSLSTQLMSDSMLQRLQAEVAKRPRGMRVTWRLEAPPAPQQQQQQQEGQGAESVSGSGEGQEAAAEAAEGGAGRGAQTGATSPGSDVQVRGAVRVPNMVGKSAGRDTYGSDAGMRPFGGMQNPVHMWRPVQSTRRSCAKPRPYT